MADTQRLGSPSIRMVGGEVLEVGGEMNRSGGFAYAALVAGDRYEHGPYLIATH